MTLNEWHLFKQKTKISQRYLSGLFDTQNVTYKIIDQNIILNKTQKEIQQQKRHLLKGTVKDDLGQSYHRC